MHIEKRMGANLPHWRAEAVVYAVTFRLADSLPRIVVDRLRYERELLLRREAHLPLTDEERRRIIDLTHDIEEFLDTGAGSCVLRDSAIAAIVYDSLMYHQGARYELGAWCIMPNHVHVILRAAIELSKILHTWKSFSGRRIREAMGTTNEGALWQPESYDRIIRDEEEFANQTHYVLDNPRKANLTDWKWVGDGGLKWKPY